MAKAKSMGLMERFTYKGECTGRVYLSTTSKMRVSFSYKGSNGHIRYDREQFFFLSPR